MCEKTGYNPNELCKSYDQQAENIEKKEQEELDKLFLEVYGRNFEDHHNYSHKTRAYVIGFTIIAFGSLILWEIFGPGK